MEKALLVIFSFFISVSLQIYGLLGIVKEYGYSWGALKPEQFYMCFAVLALHMSSVMSYGCEGWRGWGRNIGKGFLMIVHNGGAQHLGGVAAQLLPPFLGTVTSENLQWCGTIIFSAMFLIGTYCREDELVMVLREFAVQLGAAAGELIFLMGRIANGAFILVAWLIAFRLMQIKSCGDTIQEKRVVEKVLRCLPPKFDHAAAAIEESKDLSKITMYELTGSLLAHEQRINRSVNPSIEQAFQSKHAPKSNFGNKGEFRGSQSQNKGKWRQNEKNEQLEKQAAAKFRAKGKGTIAIHTKEGKKLITDVLYVPNLSHNLLSVGQLIQKDYSVYFDDGRCKILDKKRNIVIANVEMRNKIFPLTMPLANEHALKVNDAELYTLWHLQYGHLHNQALNLLKEKNMVKGLPSIKKSATICEGCIYGKMHKLPFPKTSWRASAPLELVHSDICGPMQTPTPGNKRYFILFIDDYTRHMWIYFLNQKSEAFSTFLKFQAQAERESSFLIKILRTDRGGEFLYNLFLDYCKENGIKRQLTVSYTPQQNGLAERKNRTIVEMARSMLKGKGVPNLYWAEAVHTAVYILNWSPTKAVRNKTPFEAWYKKKPVVDHFKIFGCIAYAPIPSQKREKFDDKGQKLVFVGYSDESKGYRLLDPSTRKKYKARLVAKGYSQQPEIDSTETYAPVARNETTRTVLAIATQLELQVYQLDVKSAFLNGEIEEEVYVEQPEGFIIKDKEEKVCHLKKALYGLKQAPRAWNSKINSYFIENGFNRSLSESSLYVQKVGEDFLTVCLYVDDLIYFGTNSSLVEDFKKKMMEKFEMTDLGQMRYFLNPSEAKPRKNFSIARKVH
ncbi:UNVERIFIED_CONTAM: Retrovirus-related Pol polyprotein from transposon TNT 1-94 [Sesamum latifolium]|uniref:Retrovirus-related Pol polyprotein from transposon TNT 1-94 n=1 Tax=Sesamum latifolium TaxID=2727402 RepID=A0AAW2VCF3_9LAMI